MIIIVVNKMKIEENKQVGASVKTWEWPDIA